jgi:hypothetical protein
MASKTILDCEKGLQEAWAKIVHGLASAHPGYRLRITETHVPPEEQKARYNKGRNGLGEILHEEDLLTEVDGTERMSPQNFYPSKAVMFSLLNPKGWPCLEPPVLNSIYAMAKNAGVVFISPDTLMVETVGKKKK